MTLRVVQWSTGNVGRSSLRCIIRHPDLELVGVYVHSADKVGVDAGELCGLPATGVLATDDVDYLDWMLERVTVHPAFAWTARGPADWREHPADWPATRYEEKAIAAGRRGYFLRFVRRAG